MYMTDSTINLTANNNFILNIPELPIISEMAQDVLIPNTTLMQAVVPYSQLDIPMVGDKIEYGDIDVGFIMDENFDGYVEIWNWMNIMAGTDTAVENRFEYYCDVSVIILNNEKEKIRTFVFKDCWPTSISALAMNSDAGGEPLSAILTLAFADMYITPRGNDITGVSKYVYNTDHPDRDKVGV